MGAQFSLLRPVLEEEGVDAKRRLIDAVYYLFDKIEEIKSVVPSVSPSASLFVDNAVIRGDGVGGSTQDSLVLIDDSGNVTIPGTASVTGYLYGSINVVGELTIASGAVAMPSHALPGIWLADLDTQSDDAKDALDSVTGGVKGDILILQLINASRLVNATESGNMTLGPFHAFDFLGLADKLQLISRDGSTWDRLTLANN